MLYRRLKDNIELISYRVRALWCIFEDWLDEFTAFDVKMTLDFGTA